MIQSDIDVYNSIQFCSTSLSGDRDRIGFCFLFHVCTNLKFLNSRTQMSSCKRIRKYLIMEI